MDFLMPFQLTPAQIAVFMVLVPICTGIVALIKNAGCESRLLPIWSLALGVVLAQLARLVVTGPEISVAAAILIGLIVGLMASGVWSQGKALLASDKPSN